MQDCIEKVNLYASQKLTRTQRNYCVTRRELLAVVIFLDQFRHYLLGRQFIVRTDHSSLRWIFNFKEPQGQLARWLEALSQFKFQIIHREGKKHLNADSLSRRWEEIDECSGYERGVKLSEPPCGGCKTCTRMYSDWLRFDEQVDNVHDLGNTSCRRMTTRAVAEKSSSDSLYLAENGVTMGKLVVPSQSWFPGYTPDELSRKQREDPNLSALHEWIDNGSKPDREEAASYSPATRTL